MENTENLKLPYIMPSQAQKHVTHNEAIRQLDALVQLSVVAMDVSEPPSSPIAGARYIIGENDSGAWAGREGHIAAYTDGFWTFFEPREGWLAYVEDQSTMFIRTAGRWQDFPLPKALQNMDSVGIGATSDNVNKLSVNADASLFSHSGNGHQMKINKAASNQSASLVFQSDWAGHAEFGLTGSNDFQVKVSDDGGNFQTAMQVDKATGRVEFPLGAATATRIDFSGRWIANINREWITFSKSYSTGSENFNESAGVGSEPTFDPTSHGPFVRRGSRFRKILAAFRPSENELAGLNVRLVFQYGPWGQPWTSANISTEVLYAVDNFALSAEEFSKIDQQLSDYLCPEDGFLLMFVQPAGSLTATRDVFSTIGIEVLSA